MSPLPERRKSAEELAELRKSLGIPAGAGAGDEPPGGQEAANPAGDGGGVEEEPPPVADRDGSSGGEPDEEPVVLKPVRSLKRAERAAPIHPPRKAREESGKIPAHRHSERELLDLRMKEAHSESPAVVLEQLHIGPFKVIATYLACLAGFGLVFLADWAATLATPELPARWIADFVHRPDLWRILVAALGAVGGAVLLLSAWIWRKRPRSSHHAAILTIIAVLVLVFGILHLLPDPHGA